ncbi:phage tail tape measure protein [uncultured Cohaesibacter sp.]|uniref:phage tail tape measure protein n=1 Tax=uncultured Cohaesibacter sp. TaxID=1002546 RepID=UPI0029C7D5B0|nr:phage tail tape measure protein [uncultured Cohaesibacter sp.]
MGVLTSKLILSLVDRVSAPARAVKKTMDNLKLAQVANNRKMSEMRGRMMDAAAMGYTLSRALSAPIKSAMAFESAMADVNKVVDFAAPDGLKQMSADILAMSRRIPMAAEGIAQIVAAAGQAGMQGGELLQFAEMAAKVGVAFDISADQAGESLAKIKTALGLTVADTQGLADAMNYLSNTSASAAPDLLDFMSRVGSIGRQYGFTEQQTVALGSAMIAAGAQADVAATSFRNVGKALVRGENATKAQSTAFAKLGLNATDVANRMQKDAVGTFTDVINRIRNLPKEVQAANISALFGDEARAIAPLISNSQLLADSLAAVSDKTKYLGSAQQEFEVRSKTTENALQLFRNQMEELSIAIGSALLPAMTNILATIGPIIGAMADWASAHPKLTTALVGLASALTAVKVAATAMRFAFLFGKGGLLSLLGIVPRLASVLMALVNPMALVRGAMMALRVVLISSGIGAVVAAIAMAGVWIYNNWNNLSAMFSAFGSAFMGAIQPIMPLLQPVIDGVKWLWDSVTGLLGTVEGGTGKWTEWGAEAGRVAGEFLAAYVQLPGKIAAAFADLGKRLYEAGAEAMTQLWEGMKAAAQQIIDWASGIAEKIASPFKAIGGLISKYGATGTNGGHNAHVKPLAGARAAGGAIAAGRTYLVGELGPELVTASRNGYVHDAGATRSMLGGQGAGSARSISMQFGNIVIQGVQDPRAIAAELEWEIRDRLAGLQADLTMAEA